MPRSETSSRVVSLQLRSTADGHTNGFTGEVSGVGGVPESSKRHGDDVKAGFGNGRSTKPWIPDYPGDDLDKGSSPRSMTLCLIAPPPDPHMHSCTAVNSLFSSVFES